MAEHFMCYSHEVWWGRGYGNWSHNFYIHYIFSDVQWQKKRKISVIELVHYLKTLAFSKVATTYPSYQNTFFIWLPLQDYWRWIINTQQNTGQLTSSGDMTPYWRCWYWGCGAVGRWQFERCWPAKWNPSSVVVFLYTGLSKFMLCTDRLRKYRYST